MYQKTEQEIMKNWEGDINHPIVSICCGTYNHEKYIIDAIESFLMQETNFPFEIIIRDDCSTDQTTTIVQKYADHYPNIIKPIFEKENQYSKGVMHWSVSFKQAIGKYIALCEGDDYWLSKDKLFKQYNYMNCNENIQLSFHNAIVANEHKEKLKDTNSNYLYGEIFTTKDIINNWFISTQTIMFKNNLEEDYITNFFGVINGDWTIQLICSLLGEVHFIGNLNSVYRKNPNSLSNQIGKDKVYRAMKLITLFDKFDTYSDYKFHKEIEEKKKFFLNELILFERRKDSHFCYYLSNPREFIHKLIRKIIK